MPKTLLSKIPYPSGSDAPAAAADMMAAFSHLDDRVVLPAIDEADRDARYADAPPSALVVAGPSKTIWMKTGPNPTDWLTVYHDTGWVQEGFTIASGWDSTILQARKNGVNVNIRCELTRTGSDIQAWDDGQLPDVNILYVPPQFRIDDIGGTQVVGPMRSLLSGGEVQLYTSGLVRLISLHSNAKIETGEMIRFTLTYMGK